VDIKELTHHELSCNQLILLLESYRGTQLDAQVMGTTKEDITRLLALGLISTSGREDGTIIMGSIKVTDLGHTYINRLLAISPKEEESCENHAELSIHAASYPSHFR